MENYIATGARSVALGINDIPRPTGICTNPVSEELAKEIAKEQAEEKKAEKKKAEEAKKQQETVEVQSAA